MTSSKPLVLALMTLGLLLIGGLAYGPLGSVDAASPFHQDTAEPCLGDDDPFCADGDGGGGGATCYSCSWKNDTEGNLESVTCKKDNVNGGGESCTAHMSGGSGYCNIPRSNNCA